MNSGRPLNDHTAESMFDTICSMDVSKLTPHDMQGDFLLFRGFILEQSLSHLKYPGM